jgi:cytochrome c553
MIEWRAFGGAGLMKIQDGRRMGMKYRWGLGTALLLALAIGALSQQQPGSRPPGFAFPFGEQVQQSPRAEEPGPLDVPGSAKTYTQAQIDDPFSPPDWFPNEHPPMPQIVAHGSGKDVRACDSCHLTTGMGHPESAIVTGFSVPYFLRQMADMKSGERKTGGIMDTLAKSTSEEDARQAATYFSSLKPFPYIKVVETETVAKSYVERGGMRLRLPSGGTEPLGKRIIVLPEDEKRIMRRDPHGSVTMAYVPVGSLARGKDLVTTGGSGKTISCAACHGLTLQGLGDVPRIAGLQPIYIFRQLYSFQNNNRAGASAALMKVPVVNLSEDDMIAISAYVGSLAP